MKIEIMRLTPRAVLPERGSAYAAGMDLHAELPGEVDELWILPHKTALVPTGIAVAIPEGYFGAIYARSGLASKHGLRPGNCVGVIDSDYRGEVKVALHNDSDERQVILLRERIAQLVIQPYLPIEWDEVDDLDETDRGQGGFGSTGRE